MRNLVACTVDGGQVEVSDTVRSNHSWHIISTPVTTSAFKNEEIKKKNHTCTFKFSNTF